MAGFLFGINVMSLLTVIFIALGLAMDAFAVSITNGIIIKRFRIRHALRISLFFGVFQAVMPLIGWFAGLGVREVIAFIDHWIAFGLLSFIGSKMIYESMAMDSDNGENKTDAQDLYVLLILSVATSIDALAVGLSLTFLEISIITPAIIIGVITFLFSFMGVYIGSRCGHFFEKKIEVVGGLILIGIGLKILVEHLT